MRRMSSTVQWRSLYFLSRYQCYKFSLSSSSIKTTMIGFKSTGQNTSTSPQLIIVEGNIGVGKSTLACRLARQLNYRVFLEPTTKNPYLAKFYQDPKKYALKLQLWIFKQRFRTYMEATKHVLQTGQGVLLDRSVFSDAVFAEVNHQQGTISHEGYEYYNDLRKQALKAVLVPHTTLYLDVPPETCSQRIHGRGRDYESGIPLEYLKGLDTSYKKFLDEMRNVGSRVLEYNWTDYGYKFEVAEDIKKGHIPTWNQENLHVFNKLILDESMVKEVLTLSHSVPEAVISEDEEEEPLTVEPQLQIKPKQCSSGKKLSANLTQQLVPSVEGN
ncbi:deoxyguanosine kinase-like isoform X1 [Oculina patagonica]